MIEIPPLYEQQEQTADFYDETNIIFDMSDPGTGKTRGHLEPFVRRLKAGRKRKMIVFAPKSILQPAWGNDIDKFYPGVRYQIANAANRERAFRAEADIYITNHDAIKWIMHKKCPLPKDYWDDFDTSVIDESDAYSNPTSKRSKDMRKFVAKCQFEWLANLTGTPTNTSIVNIWHQQFILDGGERLGDSYWKFRNVVQEPEATGPGGMYTKWVDRPGAEEAVFDMLRDITIRHPLTGVPGNHAYAVRFDLSPKVRKAYDEMLEHAITMADTGEIVTAVHASNVNEKLSQIASGAAYTNTDGSYVVLDDKRPALVADLVAARDASVVVYQWRHQRDGLLKAAASRGLRVAFIDGSVTNPRVRSQHVGAFQAGELDGIFIHPRSAGHGLTLTRGRATIYVAPITVPNLYKQVFHRIVRKTQEHETETIHIVANNTIDVTRYETLDERKTAMELFLMLVEQNKEAKL